jgi:heterodisulfide reductase subunit A
MMDVGRHPNIELLDYSEVVDVKGYVGNFDVKVRKKPRYVQTDLCTGCGLCVEACVLRGGKGRLMVPSEFDEGLGKRAAAYIPFAQAIPLKATIDPNSCLWLVKGKCSLKCQDVCGTDAIDFEMQETFVDFRVGSIVVATGFQMWDPVQIPEYGYGTSPNILTSLEFERLTNAGGPTAGEIIMADGAVPEKVAIIHCVGSRDERAHRYCSRFCCMYSLKQAHQVKEKTGAEVYSIYMDMRTFGKDYEEFYRRNREEGIQFIQGRPSQVTVDPDTGRLYIDVEDIQLGQVLELDVDMVVLATAIEPPENAGEIASTFGLGRTPDGWFAEAHPKLRPVETATAGVFLAGCAQGPRDVPDTVAHAGAAASEVVRIFNQGEVTISPTVAEVNPAKCVGCGECILSCPYTAIWRNTDEKAEVNPALCQGCGTCAAACPSGAITALHFTDDEIVAQIDGLIALAIP